MHPPLLIHDSPNDFFGFERGKVKRLKIKLIEMKYPVVIEERGASEKGGLRQKRFHQMHLNIGCVKGFKCCEDVKCKPYCSMCSYGKLKSNCLAKSKQK